MATISPPASHRTPFLRFLQRAVPLLTLAGLISCGGSSNTPGGRGGGGGGGGGGADCSQPVPFPTSPISQGGLNKPVPSTYMDLHVGSSNLVSQVSVPFGSLRLWDTATGWAQINTSKDVFDFSTLDGFVSAAQAKNVDILYNLARTPAWISTNASDTSCAYSDSAEGGPGQCDPPSDVTSIDGSGTDAAWIAWVSAVASRNASQYNHQIKYYEIWNEWNASLFWLGTPFQLVRMEQDARCVIEGPPPGLSCNPNSSFPSGTGLDPDAQIVSPSPVGSSSTLDAVQQSLNSYFGTTVNGNAGGKFADVIGFHGYVSTGKSGICPIPEQVITVIDDMNTAVGAASENGKPWFDTEDGWSKASDEGFLDQDREAAFLARYDMIQASMGVARGYWYRWDSTMNYEGALWSNGTPIEAVSAWQEVSKWMVGATLSSACKVSGTVWQCGFTRSGGYQAIAVWDASQDCLNGSCTFSNFTVPSGYNESRDLTDKVTTISPGSTIQIGAKPVLLENGPIP